MLFTGPKMSKEDNRSQGLTVLAKRDQVKNHKDTPRTQPISNTWLRESLKDHFLIRDKCVKEIIRLLQLQWVTGLLIGNFLLNIPRKQVKETIILPLISKVRYSMDLPTKWCNIFKTNMEILVKAIWQQAAMIQGVGKVWLNKSK